MAKEELLRDVLLRDAWDSPQGRLAGVQYAIAGPAETGGIALIRRLQAK
ncbi:hypothetical protein ACNJYD_04800 [Bradyrhizobium sp. DASA03005]|nr:MULTISPECIES: hypothetical protein [Bradyrhizobium]MBR1171475.1 hypothetical protein [Bradyrhizobium liaoningense]